MQFYNISLDYAPVCSCIMLHAVCTVLCCHWTVLLWASGLFHYIMPLFTSGLCWCMPVDYAAVCLWTMLLYAYGLHAAIEISSCFSLVYTKFVFAVSLYLNMCYSYIVADLPFSGILIYLCRLALLPLICLLALVGLSWLPVTSFSFSSRSVRISLPHNKSPGFAVQCPIRKGWGGWGLKYGGLYVE